MKYKETHITHIDPLLIAFLCSTEVCLYSPFPVTREEDFHPPPVETLPTELTRNGNIFVKKSVFVVKKCVAQSLIPFYFVCSPMSWVV